MSVFGCKITAFAKDGKYSNLGKLSRYIKQYSHVTSNHMGVFKLLCYNLYV